MAPGRLEGGACGELPGGSQSVRLAARGLRLGPSQWRASPRLGGPKSDCGPGSPWS